MTTTTMATADRIALLGQRVGARLAGIQREMFTPHGRRDRRPCIRAALAEWRRAAGREPQDDPIAWVSVLGPSPIDGGTGEALLPEVLQAAPLDQEPSRWERAAFTVLTLYALHQQSQPTGMHVHVDASARRTPNSVGHAYGRLARATGAGSTKNRFDALLLARGADTLHTQLRSAIALFRSHGIPLDYGLLAQDLVRLGFSKGRQSVLLRWGRDFIAGWKPAASGRPTRADAADAGASGGASTAPASR